MSASAHIAAIDAGSNGIRLVVAELRGPSDVKVVHAERASVRLGKDAFEIGRLRDETIAVAAEAFRGFRQVLDRHSIIALRAVATSAAREASNTDDLLAAIQEASDISLEVIDALEEAQLMFNAIATWRNIKEGSSVLIDMGGGSVEITVARKGRALGAESLPLGPVRLLCELDRRRLDESNVDALLERHAYDVENLLRAELDGEAPRVAFAAGGNLEALGNLRTKLLGKSKSWKVKIGDLESMIPLLLEMPVEERMEQLNLRSDRADVIAIAAIVLHSIMDEAELNRVLLPGLGIKDGILLQLSRLIKLKS